MMACLKVGSCFYTEWKSTVMNVWMCVACVVCFDEWMIVSNNVCGISAYEK